LPKPPHILIINPDEWRWDVMGHMGNTAAVTPNLDALVAAEAVSFRHAYCQNGVCTPSRCSFMSGWYPHVRGHRTMYHMLRPEEPMLLRTLKQNGYFVWWGGKNDVVPAQNGFGEYCDVKYDPPRDPAQHLRLNPEYRGRPGTDLYYSFYGGKLEIPPLSEQRCHDIDWGWLHGALDFIRDHPADKPLCMYLPLQYPHPVYAVEEPWHSMIDRAKLPRRIPAPDWTDLPATLGALCRGFNMQGWTEDRWTELRACYYGMCARLDHQVGMLMAALRQAGMYDDTAIFIFSDHGDFAGDYGLVEKDQNTFQDCLMRVPFIIKPPRGVSVKPRVSDAMVELVDFPATVEALTGIAPRHSHFGQSLLPVLAGQSDHVRDAVFAEGGRLAGETQAMELKSASHDNPAGHYYPRMLLQAGPGVEHGKAAMLRTPRFKYVRRLYEKDELYDLAADPDEAHNRIDDPALAAELARLKDRMLTWYQQTCDAVPHDMDER
jgi:arylsulfatase A-like enzyme